MQCNTCDNPNIKLIITILQKYSTGLHMFGGIETKLKLQTNKTTEIVVGRFP
jgi:hypothetical protein